jgi:hypothetical protein
MIFNLENLCPQTTTHFDNALKGVRVVKLVYALMPPADVGFHHVFKASTLDLRTPRPLTRSRPSISNNGADRANHVLKGECQ